MAGAATSVIFVLTMKYVFVMTKPVFWRDKSMLVAKKLLIMFVTTKYFCHNKTFVVTNICRDNRVYCDNTFVSTSLFVATSLLLCDKQCVCRNKSNKSTVLSRQNNNNNVHLSCAYQSPERSHDTYDILYTCRA